MEEEILQRRERRDMSVPKWCRKNASNRSQNFKHLKEKDPSFFEVQRIASMERGRGNFLGGDFADASRIGKIYYVSKKL